MSIRVLFIAFEFPPINTTGNYRSAAFCKELVKFDCKPIVLTIDETSGVEVFNKPVEKDLLSELPSDISVLRFPVKRISSFWKTKIGSFLRIKFRVTEGLYSRWLTNKNKSLIYSKINQYNPDIIYLSLPPFSLYKLGLDFNDKLKLPLVVDMRDAWSMWSTSPFPSRIHYLRIKFLERKLFKKASRIIGVTQEQVDDFKKQHPLISDSKFEVIFNGVFKDDLSLGKKIEHKTVRNEIHIGYIGSYYYDPDTENIRETKWYRRKGSKMFYYWPREEKWIYRSPYFFLRSLEQLKKENIKNIYFHHVGNIPHWLTNMVKEMGLLDQVKFHGFVSHKSLNQIQSNWDYVLSTSEKVIDSEHFCLPSKTFEYIKYGLPILAFVTNGAQKRFFNNLRNVVVFNPDDVLVNSEKLKKLFTNFELEDSKFPEEYTREYQAEKLFNVFQYLINENADY